MKPSHFLKWIFWNKEERRIRALWRIGLHTLLLAALIATFTLGLVGLRLLSDLVHGARSMRVSSGQGLTQFLNDPVLQLVITSLLMGSGIFLSTYLAGRFIDRRKFSDFGFHFSRAWWIDFIFGLGLGGGLMALIFLAGWLTGNVQVVGFLKSYTQGLTFPGGFLFALGFFVLVGIYEEVLSRGYHLINLAEGFGHVFPDRRTALIVALILSSAVFGLLHGGNPGASWVSTLNITLAGIFLGLGMILTGRLAISIGLHITWNFFQGNIFGFAVSGTRIGGTVLLSESTGPEWLTGGAFGPEAGVLGLIAMIIGSLLIYCWVNRHGRQRLRTELAEYSVERPQDGQVEEFPNQAGE